MKWIVIANPKGARVFQLDRSGQLTWIREFAFSDRDFEPLAEEVARYLRHERGQKRFSVLQVVAQPEILEAIRNHSGSSFRRWAEWTIGRQITRSTSDSNS